MKRTHDFPTFSRDGDGLSLDAAEDRAHGHDPEPGTQEQGDDGQKVGLLLRLDDHLVRAFPARWRHDRLSSVDQTHRRSSPVL